MDLSRTHFNLEFCFSLYKDNRGLEIRFDGAGPVFPVGVHDSVRGRHLLDYISGTIFVRPSITLDGWKCICQSKFHDITAIKLWNVSDRRRRQRIHWHSWIVAFWATNLTRCLINFYPSNMSLYFSLLRILFVVPYWYVGVSAMSGDLIWAIVGSILVFQ